MLELELVIGQRSYGLAVFACVMADGLHLFEKSFKDGINTIETNIDRSLQTNESFIHLRERPRDGSHALFEHGQSDIFVPLPVCWVSHIEGKYSTRASTGKSRV